MVTATKPHANTDLARNFTEQRAREWAEEARDFEWRAIERDGHKLAAERGIPKEQGIDAVLTADGRKRWLRYRELQDVESEARRIFAVVTGRTFSSDTAERATQSVIDARLAKNATPIQRKVTDLAEAFAREHNIDVKEAIPHVLRQDEKLLWEWVSSLMADQPADNPGKTASERKATTEKVIDRVARRFSEAAGVDFYTAYGMVTDEPNLRRRLAETRYAR